MQGKVGIIRGDVTSNYVIARENEVMTEYI